MRQSSIVFFNELVSLNKSIQTLYDKLALLEINNKVDSKEYKECINYLDTAHFVIMNKLNNSDITTKELDEYQQSIIENMPSSNGNYYYDLFDLLEDNSTNRLFNILESYLQEEHASEYMEVNEVYFENENSPEDDDDEVDDPEIDEENQQRYNDEIDFDYYNNRLEENILLDYLIEEIKNEKNKEIRDELIKVKYRLIYSQLTLEKNFLQNIKKPSKTSLYVELLNIYVDKLSDDIEVLCLDQTHQEIENDLIKLSTIKDNYYNDTLNIVRIRLRIMYLKTKLSQLINNDILVKTEKYSKKLKYNSKKTKEYIENAYKTKKNISTLKKVDL